MRLKRKNGGVIFALMGMRALSFLLIFTFLVVPLSPLTAASGVPSIFSYQGRLSDSSGNLLGGSSGTTYYFKFSIWDNPTAGSGTKLWPTGSAGTVSTTVREGVFNVNIGDTVNGYPDALNYNFNNNNLIYLQIEASSNNSTFETLTPRQQINSSLFAQLSGAVSGTGQSSFGTTTPIANSVVSVIATSSTAVAVSIQAISNQIADLFQILNSSGSKVLFANASGGLFSSSTLQATGPATFYDGIFSNSATTSAISNLTTINSTSTNATTTTLAVTGSATSTFGGSLAVSANTAVNGNFSALGLAALSGGIFSNNATSTITNLTILNGTTTNATTTTFAVTGTATSTFVGGIVAGGGLKVTSGGLVVSSLNCSILGNGGKLTTDANGVFFCATDNVTGGGSGITSLNAQYSSAQIGATQLFATGTPDTNIQMTITSGTDTHTFTPTWVGSLAVNRGGTGVSSFTANSLLYSNSAGTGLAFAATSTLNIGGNAGSATVLQTGRNINGVSFNGSGDITINAASSTLLANNNSWSGANNFTNTLALGSTTPWAKLSVELDTSNPAFVVANNGSTTPSLFIGGVNQNGFVGIGTTTTPSLARLVMDGTMSQSGAGTAVTGIHQIFTFNPTANNTTQVGNRLVLQNTTSGTATNTAIAQIIRIIDNSNTSNLTRGLEVVASAGNTTYGVNTGIRTTGHTFGIQAITTGLAGGTSTPAAIYGENTGTTQGDIMRLYSSTMAGSSQNFAQFYQNTSAFTGTGLLMNFAVGSGSFTGNFIDLQQNSISHFRVTNFGTTTIGRSGQTTNAAGLLIPFGSICVDDDGSCTGTTTGAIAAVSYLTGHTNDVAEYYYSSEPLETGDIVYTLGGAKVAKATTTSRAAIGAVSTKPGVLLGAELPTPEGTNRYPIGLAGRIPVKVSTESGAISVGDRIILSSLDGIGMKDSTTTGGTIVGIALEEFNGTGEYLSRAVVETETTKVATGEQVCTRTLVHNDGKQGGGADSEGSGISSGGASDSYVENCVQEKVSIAPQNKPAIDASVNGNPVKIGKIVMFIDLTYRELTVNNSVANNPAEYFENNINLKGNNISDVGAIYGLNNKWSIDTEGNIIANSITANKINAKNSLEVGTPEAPAGVTLYDTGTKQPYCLYITNGTVQTISGKCSENTGTIQPTSSVPTPEVIPQTETQVDTTTSAITPTAEAPIVETTTSQVAPVIESTPAVETTPTTAITETTSTSTPDTTISPVEPTITPLTEVSTP